MRAPDRRFVRRPHRRGSGPLWPLALELARLGTPIGVAPMDGSDGYASLVSVDVDGVLVELRRGDRLQLVRWSLRRSLRYYPSLAELVGELRFGRALGWLPGRIEEHKDGRRSLVSARVFQVDALSPVDGEDDDDDEGE